MSDLIYPGERMSRLRIVKSPTERLIPAETFEVVDEYLPSVACGQVLVRVIYLSVDAGTRASMNTKRYVVDLGVGDSPKCSNAVGQVIASAHPDYPLGSIVSTPGSEYLSHLLLTPDKELGIRRIEPNGLPLSAFAGTLGVTGFASYAGVFGPFELRPDECFVVSGAAGAVGSIAGQFAKIAGARVVGVAGSKEKCEFLVNHLGFDAAVDYKDDLHTGLDSACPDGIDYYFENVGGEVQRAVFDRMNQLGRIAVCGQMSQYLGKGDLHGPNMMNVIIKRLSIRGFMCMEDFQELLPKFEEEARTWLQRGVIKNVVTEEHGFEKAHVAINNLVSGKNFGKQLIKIAEVI